jgi:hypothetical protein
VHDVWLHDLESLEAISQDSGACDVCLRMADLSQRGRLEPFLHELAIDADIDAATKSTLAELACEAGFLSAVEDYVHRTRVMH